MLVSSLIIALAYMLGAIPFGLMVSRLAGISDIRKEGSGNIGATNVWRIAGAKYAVWVFAGDIGKGVAAVLLAHWAYTNFMTLTVSKDLYLSICGMAAVVGHVFPVYLKFRGGKGVNTALGVVATLLPFQTLIGLGVFVVTVATSRFISLGSILATIALTLTVLIQKYVLHYDISNTFVLLTLVITILVIYAHRKNIARLISGTENRFNFSGKSKSSDKNV